MFNWHDSLLTFISHVDIFMFTIRLINLCFISGLSLTKFFRPKLCLTLPIASTLRWLSFRIFPYIFKIPIFTTKNWFEWILMKFYISKKTKQQNPHEYVNNKKANHVNSQKHLIRPFDWERKDIRNCLDNFLITRINFVSKVFVLLNTDNCLSFE